MQKRIEEIQMLARKFRQLEGDENAVCRAINALDASILQELLDTYQEVVNRFQPVNLLRFEVLNQRRNGIEITPEGIQEIKENIKSRNIQAFEKYGALLTTALEKYPMGSRDIFANWQNAFRTFHPFFYPAKVRATTEAALEKLAKYLLTTLKPPDFKYHFVDFRGATNFGATYCWIVLYPKSKGSHRKAYQLLLRIDAELLEAGLTSGSELHAREANDVEEFVTLAEVEQKLQQMKPLVIEKNNHLINFWKFAPGEGGKYWDEFYQAGIIAVGWEKIGDLTRFENSDALATELGLNEVGKSNEVGNLENFRDAAINDIVIANRGKSKCLGIGVIKGEYQYDPSRTYFKHVRKVDWILNQPLDFDKTIFRPDTFSPTLKWELIKKRYIESDPKLEKILSDLDQGIVPLPPVPPEITEGKNYWWLNANPKIWSIDECEIGDLQSYTSHNEKGNKRRIYKYFQEVQPGDLVIGYESSPVRCVKAIFEITEALHEDDKEGEIINFEIREKVKDPVEWAELQTNPELKNCEVFINNQGSLFKLTAQEYEIIRDLIDERNIAAETVQQENPVRSYSVAQALEEIFLEEPEFTTILDALRYRKNIILQGPPGVGRTFIAKKLAYSIMQQVDERRIKMVQFHQSYAYEDFIQGIRPDDHRGFRLKNGLFYEFCKNAERDPKNDYFFIIDEINRGNLSKIFGELLMLIEADKRGKKYQIPLTYAGKDDAPFSVPENLYLIGTMNTADRSLALVDYALRRRFAFIDLTPQFHTKFIRFVSTRISSRIAEKITQKISYLNEVIERDKNLGKGFQIGHSFFCNLNPMNGEDRWYQNIIAHEIAPLLREYWFDELEKAEEHIKILRQV
jgi:5-methylcytosine-specific restriction protein B